MYLLAWFGVFSQPCGLPQGCPVPGAPPVPSGFLKVPRASETLWCFFVALLTGNKQGSLLVITKSKPY